MLEFIIIMTFVVVSFYVVEKDNEDSELYKILHKKQARNNFMEKVLLIVTFSSMFAGIIYYMVKNTITKEEK